MWVQKFFFINYSNNCEKKYFPKYDVINDDVNTFLLWFVWSVKNLLSFYLKYHRKLKAIFVNVY